MMHEPWSPGLVAAFESSDWLRVLAAGAGEEVSEVSDSSFRAVAAYIVSCVNQKTGPPLG